MRTDGSRRGSRLARAVAWVLRLVVLTILTQVGGIVLVSWALLARWRRWRLSPAVWMLGAGVLYVAVSLFVVPPLAALGGREPLSCAVFEQPPYLPAAVLYCVLNRHYVRTATREALERISRRVEEQHPGAVVVYLDAGFPFLDRFPLLPHLSHHDGRRVDLALFWTSPAGEASDTPPWPLGYWAYVEPRPGDERPCEGRSSWLRWDMTWLQPLFSGWELDRARSATLLAEAARDRASRRVLIEPHLRARLGVAHPVIRFQGCRAARHDDHIHLEVR